MAVIDIRRKHGRSIKDAKAAVERVVKMIAGEYGIDHSWQGNTVSFSRTGVAGTISVAKAEVHVHAELGFLMGALKPVIEREIVLKLDDEFGTA